MRGMFCLMVGAAALATCGIALAASSSVSGTASWGNPLTTSFTTSSTGQVSVSAAWVPKPKARYVLTVKHLTNPSDTFSYDQICQAYESQSGAFVVEGIGATGSYIPGSALCSFAEAPSGFWSVVFAPVSGGKVSATLTMISS